MHPEDHVVDLGCSIGNVSHLFAREVTRVTGIDLNKEFVDYCKSNRRKNQKFLCHDIADFDFSTLDKISGIWASFSLSYIEKPADFLSKIYGALGKSGWIALVDVSCFISGNMSLNSFHYQAVKEFELESYVSGKYDFDFGSKMKTCLEAAGFNVIYQDYDVTDLELNFNGPASLDVIKNWRARLERLNGLKNILQERYPAVCNDILCSISSEKHRKSENVKFVVAQKG